METTAPLLLETCTACCSPGSFLHTCFRVCVGLIVVTPSDQLANDFTACGNELLLTQWSFRTILTGIVQFYVGMSDIGFFTDNR